MCRPLKALRALFALVATLSCAVVTPAWAEPTAPDDARFAVLKQKVEEQSAQLDALKADIEAQRAMLDAAIDRENLDDKPSMHIYGFMDMGTNMVRVEGPQNLAVPSAKPHFAFGNVNLYFDAQADDRWSAFTEVRFTTMPNGTIDPDAVSPGVPVTPRKTETLDQSSPTPWASVRIGSIVIERAYLQFVYNDLLTLRAGFFLTPFGIWNIDHGMPTLISMALPQLEVNEMIPIRQLGFEALGNRHIATWDLGYFAYVSNGRGETVPDPTSDKMIGARVFARTQKPFWMTFGLSALTGSYADERRTFAGATVTRSTVVAYDETVVGADVSLDIHAFRFRSELVYRTKTYEPGKRDIAFGQAGFYSPDARIVDWYALASYQLPWFGIEPYGYVELYHFPTVIGDGLFIRSGGLNVHFTDRAQLKIQYAHDRFYSDLAKFKGTLSTGQRLLTRFVLAF